jgi:hypothetical protein
MEELTKRKAQRKHEAVVGFILVASIVLFAVCYNALLAYRDTN